MCPILKNRHYRILASMPALVLGLSLSFATAAQSMAPDSIMGYWVMPDGSALMEVYSAPEAALENREYAVRIVALRDQQFTVADKGAPIGETRRDIHNPDPELRQRSLQGLTIATGLKYHEGSWRGGEIYDPGSGNSYRCYVELAQGGFLRVRGHLGFALLGRTLYWHRAANYKRTVALMLSAVPAKN